MKRMTNRAKPTVSDAFRLQLQVLVTVLGKSVSYIFVDIYLPWIDLG